MTTEEIRGALSLSGPPQTWISEQGSIAWKVIVDQKSNTDVSKAIKIYWYYSDKESVKIKERTPTCFSKNLLMTTKLRYSHGKDKHSVRLILGFWGEHWLLRTIEHRHTNSRVSNIKIWASKSSGIRVWTSWSMAILLPCWRDQRIFWQPDVRLNFPSKLDC